MHVNLSSLYVNINYQPSIYYYISKSKDKFTCSSNVNFRATNINSFDFICLKVLQVNLSLSIKRIPNTMFPVYALVIVVFQNASSRYNTETKIQIQSTDTRQSAYLQKQIHFLYSPFLLTLSSCIPTQYEVASNYLMYHISF